MKTKNLIIAISLVMSFSSLANAKGGKNDGKNTTQRPSLAAGCIPANSIEYLEYNNVRTRVETGGLWWQDRPNSNADYEVPKGSGSFAIYAGGLWLGGTDVNGQLKAAVSKFGAGVDYWTGPLYDDGTAEIDAATCDRWDKFFEISKIEVQQFVLFNTLSPEARADVFPNGYEVPSSIRNWPGDGLPDINNNRIAEKIAPFIDVNSDGRYDWRAGDYPFYDLGSLNSSIPLNTPSDSLLISDNGAIDCRAPRIDRSESASRPLFGDKTYWWVFNDKGNLHTESNAPSIGMEIHGQAFAFATNDEINDMTFYNFELINRSTFTLTDTYFANYVDPDLGNPSDDFVGCDVGRGFGYCYNGDGFDEDFNGQNGYGSTPAVIGIDFFEGPYQDADGINNLVGVGPGQALNGLGYRDTTLPNPDLIVDNERFGMRRFVYYNIGGGPNGDPQLAIHYYNYMRGIWQNGQPMLHGGDGLNGPGVESIPTDFMFPGESDPLYWGLRNDDGTLTTEPVNKDWTEDNPGPGVQSNAPGDRRFVQSAGPFTLEPGNVNDITVGVVFGNAESGGRFASLDNAFVADTKAQALFDNCFQVLDGPDAPDLTIQELDEEFIMYLTNSELSNNFNEEYEEIDPNIVTPQYVLDSGFVYDNSYRFQGYQVFQLKNSDVSVGDIGDVSLARLVFQVDIVDNDTTLVNYVFDEQIQANIPVIQVEGANQGISHSFRVTEDLFASGSNRLVNYKTYYYLAIAYGTNRYKPYAQDVAPDISNPLAPASDGQKTPYLASRKTAVGGSIEAVAAIPHNPLYEENGTVVNSSYGDLVGITRWQGRGNGGNGLEFTRNTIDRIMEEEGWEPNNKETVRLDYKLGSGPLQIKVADPLNVIDAKFLYKFYDDPATGYINDSAEWFITNLNTLSQAEPETIFSERPISVPNEQLLFKPFNWGLSLEVGQVPPPGLGENNGFVGANISFGGTPWLSGVPDVDGNNPQNWILAGSFVQTGSNYNDRRPRGATGDEFLDPNGAFEGVLGGTWAPYVLAGTKPSAQAIQGKVAFEPTIGADELRTLKYLKSYVVIVTPDKSKWTRCPVLETQEQILNSIDATPFLNVRRTLSVDKNGEPVDTTGFGRVNPSLDTIKANYTSTDPNDAAYISAYGMGWFPGYALNLETGERMNMAFGEDTKQGLDNGADMLWNPTSRFFSGTNQELVWGGKHYTYVFRNLTEFERNDRFIAPDLPLGGGLVKRADMPVYDGGKQLFEMLALNFRNVVENKDQAWQYCDWVTIPIANPNTFLSSEATINLQVARPYAIDSTDVTTIYQNEGRPTYAFETDGFAVQKGVTSALKDGLSEINIVPNPYYAISEYEQGAIDNVVKLTNLPQNANITIYNMSGTLIREYFKSSPDNFLDWDLKNQVGIPIASGVYLIHIEVPDVGEKILKWFGVMRPVDLNNF